MQCNTRAKRGNVRVTVRQRAHARVRGIGNAIAVDVSNVKVKRWPRRTRKWWWS